MIVMIVMVAADVGTLWSVVLLKLYQFNQANVKMLPVSFLRGKFADDNNVSPAPVEGLDVIFQCSKTVKLHV